MNTTSEVLAFDAPKQKEQAITIGGKPYTIREMTGTDRDQYNNYVNGLTRLDSKGQPTGLRTTEGINVQLISRCLIDETRVPVEVKVLNLWPTTLLESLYDVCRKVNGMFTPDERRAQGPAKNDSAGSAVGGSE